METTILELIKQHLPRTYQLSEINDLVFRKKILKYLKRIDELSPDSKLEKPQCIFDWIKLAGNGDKKAMSFLNFIDIQSSTLIELIKPKFKKQIKATIKEMLFAMDSAGIQINNPAHMNFLGEIFGLSHLLKKSVDKYDLIEIEGSLSNGKSADFVFRNNENDDLIYIEFVSYHNIDPIKIESNEEFIKFLELKFEEKISNKTKNLNFSENRMTVNGKEVLFSILPIIWSEIVDLMPFKKAFEELELKYANVFQCCSLHVQEIDDGSFVYTFSSVNNILESWVAESKTGKS